jgi:hypothetical protein
MKLKKEDKWFGLVLAIALILMILMMTGIIKIKQEPDEICKSIGGLPLYEKICTKGCFYVYKGCELTDEKIEQK